jgi:hypothetical protein
LLGDRIVAIVLLENLEALTGIEWAQDNGIGFKVCRDIRYLYVV